ncbi:MAG: right-handed parallel beta-helix repeat-containing protein [Gemmatimonadales bacterium]
MRDALATAAPGAVIAIEGLIGIAADMTARTPHVTLTCATPGSGLFAQGGAGVIVLLRVAANGITVDRLVLDGSNADDVFFADEVADVRFTNNSVLCSPALHAGSCGFFHATPNALVSGNQFRSSGSFTGVHLQAGIDGTRIEDNTITTTAAGHDVPSFGGLRVRDGANVVIARNTVQGPWQNSAAFADLDASIIEQNTFDGAVVYGIRAASGTSSRPIAMTDNVFRNNRISGAGRAGIFLTSACSNLLGGNELQGNAADVGLVFDTATGANVFAGNLNLVVDNGGALDCDGDGTGDPNILTGPGLARQGGDGAPPPDSLSAASSRLR